MIKEYNKDEYVSIGGKKILLKKNGGIPFIKSDLRRFELRYAVGLQEIYTHVFQIDLLRLINMCKAFNNAYYVEKFRRFIKQIDVINNYETTDFKRKLPRRSVESGYIKGDSLLD